MHYVNGLLVSAPTGSVDITMATSFHVCVVVASFPPRAWERG